MTRSLLCLLVAGASLVVIVLGVIVGDLLFDPITRAMILMTWGTLTGTGSLGGQ